VQTAYPEAAFIIAGDFNKANLRKTLPSYINTSPAVLALQKLSTIVTLPSGMATRPSPGLPSANQITTPFFSSLL
jgi:hypothetical protein